MICDHDQDPCSLTFTENFCLSDSKYFFLHTFKTHLPTQEV